MPTGLTPGSARRLKQVEKLTDATMKGIRQANYLIGNHLVKLARTKILKPPKSGRIYHLTRPSGRIVRHQSSAPGQPPANFSGRLRASVGSIVKGQQLHFGAGGTVESGRLKGKIVRYARDLELGNPQRHLAKRPYLKSSINDSTKIVQNYYKQYIGQNVKATITKEGMSIKVK